MDKKLRVLEAKGKRYVVAEMCARILDTPEKRDFMRLLMDNTIQIDVANPNRNYLIQGKFSAYRELLRNAENYDEYIRNESVNH